MLHSSEKRWKYLPSALAAISTVAVGSAFSFQVHASHIQWQVVASSGSVGDVTESGVLFSVGAGLAILAAALRRLVRPSDAVSAASRIPTPDHSRT